MDPAALDPAGRNPAASRIRCDPMGRIDGRRSPRPGMERKILFGLLLAAIALLMFVVGFVLVAT